MTGQHDGMQTLEMSLTELVAAGVVSYDEAVARSLFPHDVKRYSRPRSSSKGPAAESRRALLVRELQRAGACVTAPVPATSTVYVLPVAGLP